MRQINKYIQDLNVIPLFGNTPPLDFEKLSSLLASHFGIEDFTVRLKTQSWKEKEDLLKGMGKRSFVSKISLSPLEAPVFWAMSKEDRDKFIAKMLSDKATKKAFSSPILQDGYYRFLELEALHAVQLLEVVKQMTLLLEEEEEIPEETSLCIDVEIAFDDLVAWGRLVVPKSFQEKWVQHFSAFPRDYIASALTKQLPLEIGIKIGSVGVSSQEWNKLKPGDFLVPDTILQGNQGMLMLEQTPLFQVHIHQDKIELLDCPFTPEVSMEKAPLSHQLELAEQESKQIKDVTMQVVVEIARLKITLDQLMNLSPGNFLELPPYADKKVSLTVNGQKVGVAEILHLGETIGLKILEI